MSLCETCTARRPEAFDCAIAWRPVRLHNGNSNKEDGEALTISHQHAALQFFASRHCIVIATGVRLTNVCQIRQRGRRKQRRTGFDSHVKCEHHVASLTPSLSPRDRRRSFPTCLSRNKRRTPNFATDRSAGGVRNHFGWLADEATQVLTNRWSLDMAE